MASAVRIGEVTSTASTTSPMAIIAVRRLGGAMAGEICASDSRPLKASQAAA